MWDVEINFTLRHGNWLVLYGLRPEYRSVMGHRLFYTCTIFLQALKYRSKEVRLQNLAVLRVPWHGWIHCIDSEQPFSPSQVIKRIMFLKDDSADSLIFKVGDQILEGVMVSIAWNAVLIAYTFFFKLVPHPYPSRFSVLVDQKTFL